MVLDRDCGNHSKILMEDCIKYCEENGYKCFVTNPCFEFWLLLHLCDVQNDFSIEEQAEFYNNKKISIATDIGHISTEILDKLSNSSFLLLESNYDLNTLKCSKYPYKDRIRRSSTEETAPKSVEKPVDTVNNILRKVGKTHVVSKGKEIKC